MKKVKMFEVPTIIGKQFEVRVLFTNTLSISDVPIRDSYAIDYKEEIRKRLESSLNREIFGELRDKLHQKLLKGFKETEIERNYIYHDMLQILDDTFEECKVVVE